MSTINELENIMVNSHEYKFAYGKFYSKMIDYAKYLNTFREMRVVHIIFSVKDKLEGQGIMCMLLGCS